MRREPGQTKRRRGEGGSMAVELALMLVFFLMPLVIGVLDFGQVLHVQIVLTRAARQGALAAARGAAPQQYEDIVKQYVGEAGYDVGKLTIGTPTQGGDGAISMSLQYDTSAMTILPLGSVSARLGQVVGMASMPQ